MKLHLFCIIKAKKMDELDLTKINSIPHHETIGNFFT